MRTGIRAQLEILRASSFQLGSYRPPSEGGSASLLLQVTQNCPWNRCSFCAMYKDQRFVYRSVQEVHADIDRIAAMRTAIDAVSRLLGKEGVVDREVGAALLAEGRDIFADPAFVTVYNWLCAGGKTAFLQDANSLVMRTADLLAVLRRLRQTLGSLTRVTTYARSHTLAHKTQDELRQIHEAGLDRLHIGLETGNDALLQRIGKGVTQSEQIAGGRKAMAAGFQVSEYWMPDLGGRDGRRVHAQDTAAALSAINPHYIRSRPLVPRPGTPLYTEVEQGRLVLSSPHERLQELAWMLGALEVNSRVCFDHAMNAWVDRRGGLLLRQDYEGYQFPEDKPLLLERIAEGLSVDESLHVHVRDLMAQPGL